MWCVVFVSCGVGVVSCGVDVVLCGIGVVSCSVGGVMWCRCVVIWKDHNGVIDC